MAHLKALIGVGLALAIGVLSTEVSAQGGRFDRRFVFGDSLSDTGNVSTLTGGAIPGSNYFQGRYSNGLNWVDRFSTRQALDVDFLLGNTVAASTDTFNFAYGGATTGSETLSLTTGTPPGMLAQVSSYLSYLSAGRIARPTADSVFVLWGSTNDYGAWITNQTVSASAIVAQTVGNIETAVRNLNAVGARTFLIVNQPDQRLIPSSSSLTAAQFAQIGQVDAAHNALLVQTAQRLQSQLGVRIIHVDVAALYADLIANPRAYGFVNTGNCITSLGVATGLCPNDAAAAQTVFWDSNHPTTATHLLISRFISGSTVTTLSGASSIAAQPQVAMLTNDLLRRSALDPAGMPGGTVLETSSGRLFLVGGYTDGSRDPRTDQSGFDYHVSTGVFGAAHSLSDTLRIGGYLAYGNGSASLDAAAGSVDVNSYGLGAFIGYRNGPLRLIGDVGAFYNDFDIRRASGFDPFPTARGDTKGLTWVLGAEAGYVQRMSGFDIGPFGSLRYASMHVDGYAETGTRVLDLQVGNQKADSLVAAIGGEVSMLLEPDLRPTLKLAYEYELLDDDRSVRASFANGFLLTGNPGVGRRGALAVSLGVTADLASGIKGSLAYQGRFGGGDAHGVLARVAVPF